MRQVTIRGYNFYVERGHVQVWTDGACLGNGRNNAAAGYGVFWDYDHPLNAYGPVRGIATNIRGEITAVIRAIQIASDIGLTRLCINLDSEFVINAVEEYIPDWNNNGWFLSNGQPVKNQDLFRKLDNVLDENDDMDVQFNYVEAHSDEFGNDEADRLAKQGARQYRN